MLETYNFRLTQLAYVKGAAEQVAAFRPDGKTPTQIAAMIADGQTARAEYLTKRATVTTARGTFRSAHEDAHNAVVAVYAVMKSLYRDDRDSSRAIRSLPKDDRNPEQTLARMEAISKLWASLPNPPGSATAMVAGGVTRAAFDAQLASFEAASTAFTDCDQQFQLKEGALNSAERTNTRFVSAALVQGRAQFPEGSPERAVIEAIPTEGGQQAPEQAVVSLAESPSAGAVHLQFDAARATSFELWHKGPGESEFTLETEVLRSGASQIGDYSASGLAMGGHAYRIVGVNSRGAGPASVIATVQVSGMAPPQAIITLLESQAEGAVHLFYEAEDATSYQVWHKGPGEPDFTQVTTTIAGEYIAFGLPAGLHTYKVAGVNAGGVGPLSDPAGVSVEQAQAA